MIINYVFLLIAVPTKAKGSSSNTSSSSTCSIKSASGRNNARGQKNCRVARATSPKKVAQSAVGCHAKT